MRQQLAFIDADGNWYPDTWIGMADNMWTAGKDAVANDRRHY